MKNEECYAERQRSALTGIILEILSKSSPLNEKSLFNNSIFSFNATQREMLHGPVYTSTIAGLLKEGKIFYDSQTKAYRLN